MLSSVCCKNTMRDSVGFSFITQHGGGWRSLTMPSSWLMFVLPRVSISGAVRLETVFNQIWQPLRLVATSLISFCEGRSSSFSLDVSAAMAAEHQRKEAATRLTHPSKQLIQISIRPCWEAKLVAWAKYSKCGASPSSLTATSIFSVSVHTQLFVSVVKCRHP